MTNIADRPKCRLEECDNSKFYNLNQNYQKYCCKSHQVKDKNRHILDSTREKTRINGKRHKVPEFQRYFLANLIRDNPEIKKKAEENKRKTLFKRKVLNGIIDEKGNKIPKEKKPRLPISEERRKQQSEKVKNFFKEHPEKIHVNGFKRYNNQTGYEYCFKKNQNIRYLSSWEQKFIKFIDESGEISNIYDVTPIEYYNSEKEKDSYYFADFFLELFDGIKVLIEIKPIRLVNDKIVIAKKEAALKHCKSLGIYYITLTEKELYNTTRFKSSCEFNKTLNIHECISSQYNIQF